MFDQSAFAIGWLEQSELSSKCKGPMGKKKKENVLILRVINWSEYVGNYTQVKKKKKKRVKVFKEELSLKLLIKICLSYYFSRKTKSWLNATYRSFAGEKWLQDSKSQNSLISQIIVYLWNVLCRKRPWRIASISPMSYVGWVGPLQNRQPVCWGKLSTPLRKPDQRIISTAVLSFGRGNASFVGDIHSFDKTAEIWISSSPSKCE